MFTFWTNNVNMSLMKKIEATIVEAAIRVFSRYGVKRTTMNDIASEAGIVRQTLYNVFKNKDDVLKGAINWYVNQSIVSIVAGVSDVSSLDDKLDIVFDYMVIKPFEQLQTMPHAGDVITGFNEAAKKEITDGNERYRVVIEELLLPDEEAFVTAGIGVGQLSDLIQRSAIGFKHNANSQSHLRELLNSLKRLVLSITGDV